MLGLLEMQSEAGRIDLFYGDESQVAESGYVPYGWVFEDEVVEIPAKGAKPSIFGDYSAGTTASCFPQLITLLTQTLYFNTWIPSPSTFKNQP